MAANGVTLKLHEQHLRKLNLAKRVTAIGILVTALLASSKLITGWLAHSTAVFADGLENVGDRFGSGLVLYALFVTSRPPDKEHPYGHGRCETIAGLAVGFLLAVSGIVICYESIHRLQIATEAPQFVRHLADGGIHRRKERPVPWQVHVCKTTRECCH
jgi:cation diffusion facilitator family transporter